MKIKLTSVYVDDKKKALRLYTDVLGLSYRSRVVGQEELPTMCFHPSHPSYEALAGQHAGTMSPIEEQPTVEAERQGKTSRKPRPPVAGVPDPSLITAPDQETGRVGILEGAT